MWKDHAKEYPFLTLAWGCLRDATSAMARVEKAKRDKHAQTCASLRFHVQQIRFSVLGSFGAAAQVLLDHVCRQHGFMLALQSGRTLLPLPLFRDNVRGGWQVCGWSFQFIWLTIYTNHSLVCCCHLMARCADPVVLLCNV